MRTVASLLVLVCCSALHAAEPADAEKGWFTWGNGPVAQIFKGRRLSLLQRVFGERTEQADKDWQLTVRCREALAKDQALAALNLDVSVEQAVATLEGPIPNSELCERAGKALQGVKGIQRVRNQLRVIAQPKPSVLPPRSFPALDQKPPVKLGQPIKDEDAPKPSVPPAKLMGQARNDSSWIDPNWPRTPAQPPPPVADETDPRTALATLLRANPGFGDVRFSVEGKVVWLKGRVANQVRHEDLIRAVQGTLGREWQLRDQVQMK